VKQCVLVDTDVLIDVLRQVETTISILKSATITASPIISAVTQMELIVGCRNAVELRNLDRFLQSFEIVDISEKISRQAVELIHQYRLSHGLLIPDALIAASSLVTGHGLLTKNQRDYRFIEGFNLLSFSV
jgi:predicted nucleic acid-binding protein